MSKHFYKFNKKPKFWEESERIGNGTLGALDYSENNNLIKLILTHEELFMPSFDGYKTINMAPSLNKIRQLVKNKQYKKAAQIPIDLRKIADKKNEKKKLWTNAFMPVADIVIKHNNKSKEKYFRKLDFDNAIAAIYENGVLREEFVSFENNYGVIHFQTKNKTSYNFSLQKHIDPKNKIANLKKTVAEDLNAVIKGIELHPIRGLSEPKIIFGDDSIVYFVKYLNRSKNDKVQNFKVIFKIVKTDGQIVNNKNSISVNDSTFVNIVWTILINEEMPNEEMPNEKLDKLKNYDYLKSQHINSYQKKLKLNITLQNKHIENIIYSSIYTILSSTGKYPPNLQGIWTGIFQVPWSSDWTLDGNMQVAIMSMLQQGNFSEYLSVVRLMLDNIKEFKYNAKKLYDSSGIFVPSRITDNGNCYHYQLHYPMAFLYSTSAWISKLFFEYWQYTQDNKMLKEIIYDFMYLAVKFYEDFLIEKDGKYIFVPSYSPENTPSNANNPTVYNSTYDIMVTKELLLNTIFTMKYLKIDEEKISKFEIMLNKLPTYKYGPDGELKEWLDFEDNFDHRHCAHLYSLFYEKPMEFINNPKLSNAAKLAYIKKFQHMKQEKGEMAFGSILFGKVAVRLKDSKTVNQILQDLIDCNYYETLMTSHNSGPCVFNADISGGFPSLIYESIVQSNPIYKNDHTLDYYEISLLPALPKIIKSGGSINKLNLKGGFIIDIMWKNGRITKYNLLNKNRLKHKVIK